MLRDNGGDDARPRGRRSDGLVRLVVGPDMRRRGFLMYKRGYLQTRIACKSLKKTGQQRRNMKSVNDHGRDRHYLGSVVGVEDPG